MASSRRPRRHAHGIGVGDDGEDEDGARPVIAAELQSHDVRCQMHENILVDVVDVVDVVFVVVDCVTAEARAAVPCIDASGDR